MKIILIVVSTVVFVLVSFTGLLGIGSIAGSLDLLFFHGDFLRTFSDVVCNEKFWEPFRISLGLVFVGLIFVISSQDNIREHDLPAWIQEVTRSIV